MENLGCQDAFRPPPPPSCSSPLQPVEPCLAHSRLILHISIISGLVACDSKQEHGSNSQCTSHESLPCGRKLQSVCTVHLKMHDASQNETNEVQTLLQKDWHEVPKQAACNDRHMQTVQQDSTISHTTATLRPKFFEA